MLQASVHNAVCQGAGVREECMCIQAHARTVSHLCSIHKELLRAICLLPPSCGPSSRSKGEATRKSGDTDMGVDHETSFKESVESCLII